MINLSWTIILFAQISLTPPDSFVYPVKIDTSAELELTIQPPKNVPPPLSYKIDWGDGETLNWTEPLLIQSEIYRYHRYRAPGNYTIRVMVKDTSGNTSPWSKPCSVQVVPSLVKWFAPTLEPVVAAPALDDNGNIYIGDEGGTFYSFSSSGELRWTFSTRGPIYAGVTISGGHIYLPSLDSHLYCLDTLGNLKWSFDLGDEAWTPPAIGADNNLYLTTDQGKLISLDQKGKKRWVIPLGDEISSSPTIGPDGLIYVAFDSLYCFHPKGKRRWGFGTPDGAYFFAAPVVDDKGMVYAGSFDGFIYCLRPDGRLRWRSPVADQDEIRTETVFAADGTLYCGTDGYYLCAKPPDSTVKVLYEANDLICATPAISENGTIYLLADDGTLYAINPNGRILFTLEVAGGEKDLYYTSSPVLAPDGTLYVGSWDSGLYAIYADGPPAKTIWPQFRQNAQHTGRLTVKKGK
ncbi:MAG: outer membrane protein assembly factor BamB family protein [bacterium]